MNALLTGIKHIKTTLAGVASLLTGLGLVGAALKTLIDTGEVKTEVFAAGWAAIATGVGLVFAKDADKSNSPSPTSTATKIGVALLCLGLAGPAFAHSDYSDVSPTIVQAYQDAAAACEAGTCDPAAALADAIAQAAPSPRGAFKVGGWTIAPAISVTPFVLSLRDASVSVGPNAGAGLDFTRTVSGYGGALHATLRATAGGMKPMASVFAIVPFLDQFGIRPGASYQFGGGALPFKDSFMLGLSVGSNLGYAPSLK